MKREYIIAVFVLGALYLWGLAPSVHVHDAGELTAGAWTLGIAHPPGAPLYMLVAKLFITLLPYGHIAWRANVLSAVFALATFSLLIIWAEKRSGCRWTALATGAFAVLSPVFWSQALMAEVYTLQALLLVAVIVSIDLGWRAESTGFIWGLLLACHVGLAPLTPILIVLLIFRIKGSRERSLTALRVAAAIALPLTLYLYLPLRSFADPLIDWGDPETPQRLWWHLSNKNVRGRMFSLPFATYLARAGEYVVVLAHNTHLGLLAGLIAAACFAWRSRVVFLCLLIMLYDAAFVILLDTAPLPSEAYGIPAVIACAMMLPFLRLTRTGASVLLASTLVVAAYVAPEVLLNRSFVIRDSVENVLDQVPHDAVLLTQEDNTTFPFAYLTAVEGARPDLEIYDRAGNLFRSPYDRPLFTVTENLPDYRRQQEEPFVENLLNEGREVWYATPFIEFQPSNWVIEAHGTAGRAQLTEPLRTHQLRMQPLPLRRPARPDWMSRQVLAMDAVRRAASNPREAVVFLEQALELADIAELNLQIGQLALAADARELAGVAAERSIGLAPGLAPAWSLSAYCELLAGNLEDAELMTQRAIELNAGLPNPHSTLALVRVQQERWKEAEESFSTALDRGAPGPEPFVNRGLVRERLGLYDSAIADFDQAASFDSGCGEICLRRLELIIRTGTARQHLAEETCAALDRGIPSPLDEKTLIRVLKIAATAGYPSCVEEWIDSLENKAATAQITLAYQRAQAAVERESSQ